MLKRIVMCLLFIGLSGCAQWQEMTPKQRWSAVGIGVGIAAAGYAMNDDDDTFITNTTVVIKPDKCLPAARCK